MNDEIIKRTIFLLCCCITISCKNNFDILSAKKKMVYPNTSTVLPYYKYVLELNVTPSISIDSVIIGKGGKCFKTTHALIAKHSLTHTRSIHKSGIHYLEVPLKKETLRALDHCNSVDGKLTIFYKERQLKKTAIITSFIEK